LLPVDRPEICCRTRTHPAVRKTLRMKLTMKQALSTLMG